MASGRLNLPGPGEVSPALLSQWKDLLEGKLKIAYGRSTCTWPGGSNFSNSVQVTHGIDVRGSGYGTIQCTPTSTGSIFLVTFVAIPGATTTQIQVQAFTTDGTSPLATDTTGFFWLVIVP